MILFGCALVYIQLISYACLSFFIYTTELHMMGLSAKMGLLHPSTDIPHVGTQKEKLGLKWTKHYRWA